MSTKLTLESVLADFQVWRLHKSSPHNRIPDDLKRKHHNPTIQKCDRFQC